MSRKVVVDVVASFRSGKIIPMKLTWPDGRAFRIDRVLDAHIGPSKSGGFGMRYTCRILGAEVLLYYAEVEQIWWCDGKEEQAGGF